MKKIFRTPLIAAAVAAGLGAFAVPATPSTATAGTIDTSALVNVHYRSGTWHRHDEGWNRQRLKRNKRYRRHHRAHRKWHRQRHRHHYGHRYRAPFAFRVDPHGFGFRFGY